MTGSSFSDVKAALGSVYGGKQLLEQIEKDVPKIDSNLGEDEFGSLKSLLTRTKRDTWTLVILSGLKPTGRDLKIGHLKRMIRAALPFGSEMAIRVNGEVLASSKINVPMTKEWQIGPDLDIDSFELPNLDPTEDEESAKDTNVHTKSKEDHSVTIKVISKRAPTPYVELPEIGKVTGWVRLFRERLTGGKSDSRGASNGFHVNVLGRVVNQSDPSFGEKNLSHAAWSKFRMTVRADGLNEFITTNREQFKEGQGLRIFRRFLREVFNKIRSQHDTPEDAGLEGGGDVLVRSLGVLSLNPLKQMVAEALESSQMRMPSLFDESGITDKKMKLTQWNSSTSEDIRTALEKVAYEKVSDDSFAKFRIDDSTIIVNKDHPFVLEHSGSKAELELVRTVAMVNLLTDVYSLDIGVEPESLSDIRSYRDRLLRFKALQRRQSGLHIAQLLLDSQHRSDLPRALEIIVGDALRYLGFEIKELAKPGQPEGIAYAYPIPTQSTPNEEDKRPPLYSFTFDAKSTKNDAAKTGTIDLAGIVNHRTKFKTNFAIVVGPSFTGEKINDCCVQQEVTPIPARDLGRLLELTAKYGAIPVTKLRELFLIHKHADVTSWIDALPEWLQQMRPITLDIFINALEYLKGRIPDALSATDLARVCREQFNAVRVKGDHVLSLAKGLEILVPDLVGVASDKIVVNASPKRVADAVQKQLEKLDIAVRSASQPSE